jgi:hypothetical protein
MRKSPLNLAFANLTVKTWDARERALLKVQSEVRTPVFIAELRDQLPVKGVKKSATCTSAAVGNTSGAGSQTSLILNINGRVIVHLIRASNIIL